MVDDEQNSNTASDNSVTVYSPVERALNIPAPGPSEALLASLPQTSSASPLELSDVDDSPLLDIISFLPDTPGAANGHLLRPLSTSERAAAHAIALNPLSYGLDNCSRHLFDRSWFNTAIISNLVDKLTTWSRDITSSDRWVFLPPDILNGLASGRLYPWARGKLLASIC